MTGLSRAKGFCFGLLMALLFCLGGCGGDTGREMSPLHMITEIRVTCREGERRFQRSYTEEEQMRRILHYLRRIDPYGTPEEDPETVPGADYRIVLIDMQGREQEYFQHGDRFMQVNGGAWQRIDPERAAELPQLLTQIAAQPPDHGDG